MEFVEFEPSGSQPWVSVSPHADHNQITISRELVRRVDAIEEGGQMLIAIDKNDTPWIGFVDSSFIGSVGAPIKSSNKHSLKCHSEVASDKLSQFIDSDSRTRLLVEPHTKTVKAPNGREIEMHRLRV